VGGSRRWARRGGGLRLRDRGGWAGRVDGKGIHSESMDCGMGR